MEKSILEMFQVFTSSDFQKTKDAAFRVLIPAIQHKEYAAFFSSRLYAVEPLKFPETPQITQTIEVLEGNKELLKTMDFSKVERDDRLKLNDVLNFFAILAQRESAVEVVKHVDFAYDWWRSALLVIAQSQLDHLDAPPNPSILQEQALHGHLGQARSFVRSRTFEKPCRHPALPAAAPRNAGFQN